LLQPQKLQLRKTPQHESAQTTATLVVADPPFNANLVSTQQAAALDNKEVVQAAKEAAKIVATT
jgi:16S rRNA G966 N2-methylase RsmD